MANLLNWQIFILAISLMHLVLASLAISKLISYLNDPLDAVMNLDFHFIQKNSNNTLEKVFLVILEEMSLAASLPVPQACVLDLDSSINSFVIGNNPNDAIIGVTHGFLECLNRKEMQAVIAYQLTRIANDDTKADLVVLAIVRSLNSISDVGAMLFKHIDKHNSYIIAFIGSVIFSIGSPGLLVSAFVKYIACRHRILMADKAALKLTNNAQALAAVLKKIGSLNFKSRYGILNESNLLFFAGNSCPRLDSRSAAHPSIKTRIRALDPKWKGEFPEVKRLILSDLKPENFEQSPSCLEMQNSGEEHVLAMLGEGDDNAKVILSREVLCDIPDAIITKIRDPYTVRAFLIAMLIDKKPDIEKIQMQILYDRKDNVLYKEVLTAKMLIKYLKQSHYVALVRLANPILKSLPRKLYLDFTELVRKLIAVDRKVVLFEYCIYQMLLPVEPTIRSMMPYEEAKNIILKSLRNEHFEYSIVDKAVKAIARVEEKRKRILVNELIENIAEDGVVTTYEMQYMSAICSAIGVDTLTN